MIICKNVLIIEDKNEVLESQKEEEEEEEGEEQS